MHSSRATRRRRTTAVLLASLGAASTITSATAQTSGTWAVDVGATGGSWSNPSNWSGGVVPDNGGISLFNTMPSFTPPPGGIIQDQPTITLSGLTFDSFITYLLKPTVATNNITLTGPATINTAVPSINTLNTTVFGQQSQLPFAGGAGLTKTGPGTLTLWATNIYTGGTTV